MFKKIKYALDRAIFGPTQGVFMIYPTDKSLRLLNKAMEEDGFPTITTLNATRSPQFMGSEGPEEVPESTLYNALLYHDMHEFHGFHFYSRRYLISVFKMRGDTILKIWRMG